MTTTSITEFDYDNMAYSEEYPDKEEFKKLTDEPWSGYDDDYDYELMDSYEQLFDCE